MLFSGISKHVSYSIKAKDSEIRLMSCKKHFDELSLYSYGDELLINRSKFNATVSFHDVFLVISQTDYESIPQVPGVECCPLINK